MSSVIVRGSSRRSVQPDRAVIDLGLSVVASAAPSALDQVSARSMTLENRHLAVDHASEPRRR